MSRPLQIRDMSLPRDSDRTLPVQSQQTPYLLHDKVPAAAERYWETVSDQLRRLQTTGASTSLQPSDILQARIFRKGVRTIAFIAMFK